jgi:hypothetical protein
MTNPVFIVYREHMDPTYHRELVALCDSLDCAVNILDKPNYDLVIFETHLDESGLINVEIEMTFPLERANNETSNN